MNIDECAGNSQNGFKRYILLHGIKFSIKLNFKFHYFRKAPKFFVFGNVLLDYSVQIDTDKLLQKYGFGANESRECSLDKLNTIINEIKQR